MNELLKNELQQKYDYLMRIVNYEIFKHRGAGFTVELEPIITNEVTYCSTLVKGFINVKPVWKVSNKPAFKKDRYQTPYYVKVDYGFDAHPKLDGMLPNGIRIERTSVTDVIDERTKYSPLLRGGIYAHHCKGRRVYLSVSEEYAKRFYKEKYTDVAYPFKDKLLANYSDLLHNIVQILREKSSAHYVWNNGRAVNIRVSSKYVYADAFKIEKVTFEQYNMMPLNSTAHTYGMALALIEIIEKDWPESSHLIISIEHLCLSTIDGESPFNIQIKYLPPSEAKELQEW